MNFIFFQASFKFCWSMDSGHYSVIDSDPLKEVNMFKVWVHYYCNFSAPRSLSVKYLYMIGSCKPCPKSKKVVQYAMKLLQKKLQLKLWEKDNHR